MTTDTVNCLLNGRGKKNDMRQKIHIDFEHTHIYPCVRHKYTPNHMRTVNIYHHGERDCVSTCVYGCKQVALLGFFYCALYRYRHTQMHTFRYMATCVPPRIGQFNRYVCIHSFMIAIYTYNLRQPKKDEKKTTANYAFNDMANVFQIGWNMEWMKNRMKLNGKILRM